MIMMGMMWMVELGWIRPWWWMRAFFPATTLATAPLITAHHMIINDYHCSDDDHHHMIKDILQCNFALELFSIVVSRKSRTDCSQMFFQLRARRSVSAGSQIPITIITFYALWPTILISNVCLKNIYPIFKNGWKDESVWGGSPLNIWRVLHTNYILEYWQTGQIHSKLAAFFGNDDQRIANLKIWLWLAQLVEGTFGGDRISFFSKKNQNWIGGEQTWILKRPVKVKLGLARQIFNGRCTFSVFFYKEATENRFLDKFNKLKSGREQNGSKKCARHP